MDHEELAALLWDYHTDYTKLSGTQKAMAADLVKSHKPYALSHISAWLPENSNRLIRACVVDTNNVKFTVFDPMSIQKPLPDNYMLGDDPKWVTERIMALRLLPLPPPPHHVEGVGMRIDDTVFWIIAPEGW
jgi:hypothetical protein